MNTGNPPIENRFYTISDVQRLLGFSRTTIYKHMISGALVPTKFGRAVRFTATDLEKFIASRPRGMAA